MKYQIGDRVIVREDLTASMYYRMEDGVSNSATAEMCKLRGEVVQIIDYSSDQYLVSSGVESVDMWNYRWTDEMFSGLECPPPPDISNDEFNSLWGELLCG